MLKCKRCKGTSPDYASFCIECGKPLTNAKAVTGKTERLHTTTEYQPSTNASGAPYYNPFVDYSTPYVQLPERRFVMTGAVSVPFTDYSDAPIYLTREEFNNLAYTLPLETVLQMGNAFKNNEPVYYYGREIRIID